MVEEGARNVQRATSRRAVATSPSPEGLTCGADVGRLLAPGALARLPDRSRSVADERLLNCCPLQWRGRTGIAPVSVSRIRFDCPANAIRYPAPRQAPPRAAS